jgi:hypothetical protein
MVKQGENSMSQALSQLEANPIRRVLEKAAALGLRGLIIVALGALVTAARAGEQARQYSSALVSSMPSGKLTARLLRNRP